MKTLTIGDYEITIKCKDKTDEKCTNETLFYFLNELSIVYEDASVLNEQIGCNAMHDEFLVKAREIHSFLQSNGFYDSERTDWMQRYA